MKIKGETWLPFLPGGSRGEAVEMMSEEGRGVGTHSSLCQAFCCLHSVVPWEVESSRAALSTLVLNSFLNAFIWDGYWSVTQGSEMVGICR